MIMIVIAKHDGEINDKYNKCVHVMKGCREMSELPAKANHIQVD